MNPPAETGSKFETLVGRWAPWVIIVSAAVQFLIYRDQRADAPRLDSVPVPVSASKDAGIVEAMGQALPAEVPPRAPARSDATKIPASAP